MGGESSPTALRCVARGLIGGASCCSQGTVGKKEGPLYCREQIEVPGNLQDILTHYTKAVLRDQPEDVIAFSAEYFKNMAAASKGAQSARARTRPLCGKPTRCNADDACVRPAMAGAVPPKPAAAPASE